MGGPEMKKKENALFGIITHEKNNAAYYQILVDNDPLA